MTGIQSHNLRLSKPTPQPLSYHGGHICSHRPAARIMQHNRKRAQGVPSLRLCTNASFLKPFSSSQSWWVSDQKASKVTRMQQAIEDEGPLDGQHTVLVLHVIKQVPIHRVFPYVLGKAHLALVQLSTDATVYAAHRLVTRIFFQHCHNSLKVEAPVNDGAITRKLGTLRVVFQSSRPQFLILLKCSRSHFDTAQGDMRLLRNSKQNSANDSSRWC